MGGEPRRRRLPPWPSRRADVDQPDELRIDIDPQPGTSFEDGKRVAAVVRETLAEMGWTGWPKTSGNRGIHVACRIEPNWEFPVVRRCALAFAREVERRSDLVTGLVEGGGASASSSTTTRTPRPHDRVRLLGARAARRDRLGPVTWDELPDVETEDFTLASMPGLRELGDVQAGIDEAVCDLNVLLEWVEREEAAGVGEAPYRRSSRRCPASRSACSPRAKTGQVTDCCLARNRHGSFAAP